MTGPVRVVLGWVALADQAICARDEEIARRLGWQVTRTGFGARTYRDPRFDRTSPHNTHHNDTAGVQQ